MNGLLDVLIALLAILCGVAACVNMLLLMRTWRNNRRRPQMYFTARLWRDPNENDGP